MMIYSIKLIEMLHRQSEARIQYHSCVYYKQSKDKASKITNTVAVSNVSHSLYQFIRSHENDSQPGLTIVKLYTEKIVRIDGSIWSQSWPDPNNNSGQNNPRTIGNQIRLCLLTHIQQPSALKSTWPWVFVYFCNDSYNLLPPIPPLVFFFKLPMYLQNLPV